MSHVLQDLGIDRLQVEQRVELVQKIWDAIAREVGLLPPHPTSRRNWKAAWPKMKLRQRTSQPGMKSNLML
jgi:N-glycosylase/DNA lyase